MTYVVALVGGYSLVYMVCTGGKRLSIGSQRHGNTLERSDAAPAVLLSRGPEPRVRIPEM